jgi:hypothetical protein
MKKILTKEKYPELYSKRGFEKRRIKVKLTESYKDPMILINKVTGKEIIIDGL